MDLRTSGSTHPALSRADAMAANSADVLLLVGRIMVGWIFAVSGWGKLMNIAGFATYLTNLKAPAAMAYIAAPAEFAIGVALILGLATRYAAVIGAIFVVVATALAHRYWEYPPAAQQGQFVNFLKNLSILGGLLAIFVTGAGRYSVDRMLARR
jgi:putative oxidoreductase